MHGHARLNADRAPSWGPVLGVALAMFTVALSIISVPLAAAAGLGLSRSQTTAWILVLYGLPSLVSLLLALRFRLPLLMTGNVFVMIYVLSLGGRLGFAELVGATMVAGAAIIVLTAFGLTNRLADWIPAPVVMGLLAGSVLPFVAGAFTTAGREPLILGGGVLAYLVSSRFLPRVAPVVPALAWVLLSGALLGRFRGVSGDFIAPAPQPTPPVFEWEAIATASPVLVVLIVLQANTPSLVFLRQQGYAVPERTLGYLSGAGTLLGSFLGPVGMSLSLPATAMVAGPEAGPRRLRFRSVVLVGAAFVALMALAGYSSDVADLLPLDLLLGVAGLAVVGVLALALRQTVAGPLQLGPLLAFAVALSDLSLIGLGPEFWSLALGVAVSHLLEHDGLRELRDIPQPAPGGPPPGLRLRRHRTTDPDRTRRAAPAGRPFHPRSGPRH